MGKPYYLNTPVKCWTEIQWNLSIPDTNGTEEKVLFSEVSSVQRLKCMHKSGTWGGKGYPVFRCPQFRGVLIEGFHSTVL